MYSATTFTLLTCLHVIFITKVSADYCEFGTCNENTEYCCGENRCCKKTADVWYYWAVVLLIVIIIIIAAFLYFKQLKSKYNSYSKLVQTEDEVTVKS